MFEFQRLCDTYEKLSPFEKKRLLSRTSVPILAALHTLCIPGIDAVSALAGFLVGSVAPDGCLNEQKYLLIYPSLVRIFGDHFDFATIKNRFRRTDSRSTNMEYTRQMLYIFDQLDDSLQNDLILLCLCMTGINGRLSREDKRYIRQILAV